MDTSPIGWLLTGIDALYSRWGLGLPRVSIQGNVVVARSPVILGALTLGGSSRVVTLNHQRRVLVIRDRRVWFYAEPKPSSSIASPGLSMATWILTSSIR